MLKVDIHIETIDQKLTPNGGEDKESYSYRPAEDNWPAGKEEMKRFGRRPTTDPGKDQEEHQANKAKSRVMSHA